MPITTFCIFWGQWHFRRPKVKFRLGHKLFCLMAYICLNSRGKAKPINVKKKKGRAGWLWAWLPALLSWGPWDAPSGGFMVNKDCYGPPLACTEGSSLLPALIQWRGHNGKLKLKPFHCQLQRGLRLCFLMDSGEALRDSKTAISEIYEKILYLVLKYDLEFWNFALTFFRHLYLMFIIITIKLQLCAKLSEAQVEHT